MPRPNYALPGPNILRSWSQRELLQAVKIMPTLVTAIPTYHLTRELCLAAVMASPAVLYRLPSRARTNAVCLAAVTGQGSLLAFVPVRCRTRQSARRPSETTASPSNMSLRK